MSTEAEEVRNVEREQHVVDHVAVVAHDVRGGPDRIEDLEVGVVDDAECRLRVRCAGEPHRRKNSQYPLDHARLPYR